MFLDRVWKLSMFRKGRNETVSKILNPGLVNPIFNIHFAELADVALAYIVSMNDDMLVSVAGLKIMHRFSGKNQREDITFILKF